MKIGDPVWLSLFICNTSLRGCIWPLVPAKAVFDFQNNQDRLNNLNEIKYNLHYDDVRGDFLWPPHGTTPATVVGLK